MAALLIVLPHAVTAAPPASWWHLAPVIALGVIAIAVGALTSRKGPRS